MFSERFGAFLVLLVALGAALHGCGSGRKRNGGGIRHCATYAEDWTCEACKAGFDLQSGSCLFHCQTDEDNKPTRQLEKKGLCVDDTTFEHCASEIPHMWPNTNEKVKSIRIFNAGHSWWGSDAQAYAQLGLLNVVKTSGMQVYVGTQISCDEAADDRDWQQVLELLRKLGPEHIMGLAVGNELELLVTQDYVKKFPGCIDRVWKDGYFWRKTVERVRDFDALGDEYKQIPVSTVFGGKILGGERPFYEAPDAMAASYLRNATAKYGTRWVFSLNVYPYLDPSNHLDANTPDKCDMAIANSVCFDKATCIQISVATQMRERMKSMTGRSDDLLWIGETGWSSPQASTLDTPVAACPDFSTEATFRTNYDNFLAWDLSVSPEGTTRGPDHVFYFTMRDANSFGNWEHFGLVKACSDTTCKLQKPSKDAAGTVNELVA